MKNNHKIIIAVLISMHLMIIGCNAFINSVFILNNNNDQVLLIKPGYKNKILYNAYLYKDSSILIKDKVYTFYKDSEIFFHNNRNVSYGYVYKFEYDSYYKTLELQGRIHFYETGEVYRARVSGNNEILVDKNLIRFNNANEIYFTRDKKIIKCRTTADENKLLVGDYIFTVSKNNVEDNYTHDILNIEFFENGLIKSISVDKDLTLSEINNKFPEISNIKITFNENCEIINEEYLGEY